MNAIGHSRRIVKTAINNGLIRTDLLIGFRKIVTRYEKLDRIRVDFLQRWIKHRQL